MNKVDEVYEEFWKVIIEPNGEIDFDQVKKELYDYACVMHEVAKVYCELTGSRISKPNTKAESVISVVNEHYCDYCPYMDDCV